MRCWLSLHLWRGPKVPQKRSRRRCWRCGRLEEYRPLVGKGGLEWPRWIEVEDDLG